MWGRKNEINYFIPTLSVEMSYKSQGRKDIEWCNKIHPQLKWRCNEKWGLRALNASCTLQHHAAPKG